MLQQQLSVFKTCNPGTRLLEATYSVTRDDGIPIFCSDAVISCISSRRMHLPPHLKPAGHFLDPFSMRLHGTHCSGHFRSGGGLLCVVA
jgi:hypothetical protein